MKALVVDDSKLARKKIRDVLLDAGIDDIYEAADGEEGLSVFKEELPEIVITDYEMPKKNGIQMVEEMIKIKDDIKRILITSVVNKRILIEADEVKFDDIIYKPFKKEKLRDKILEFIQN
jgi:two-component system chemotaxis response regulator CheY